MTTAGRANDLDGNLDTGTTCIPNNSNGSAVNVATTILGPLAENLYFPLATGSPAINFDTVHSPSRDAGLVVFAIYSMWPSRMWTMRSP